MNGALAQADVLGIFGREQLGLATLWGAGRATDPWAYAFRMYRNYDGHGAGSGPPRCGRPAATRAGCPCTPRPAAPTAR